MEERTIQTVEPVEDWDEEPADFCFGMSEDMDSCDNTPVFHIAVTYEDEPDLTFHSELCREHTKEYTKQYDKAKTFGDAALDHNDHQIK